MTSIIELNSTEAKKALMRSSSFSRLPIPPYFDFAELLSRTSDAMHNSGGTRKQYQSGNPKIRDVENVNYLLISNKGADLAWRPFTLIHPVLYLELVELITEPANWESILDRFKDFFQMSKVKCCSLPRVENSVQTATESSVLDYWSQFEQESIVKSLEYKYITTTDITNCYGSIYTHTLSWALHGKTVAKNNRGKQKVFLLGDEIDRLLQDIQYGQTNGIPQGNIISDLIAEIILGYADELLQIEVGGRLSSHSRTKINFEILRYRDDYRIFTNSEEDAREILLALTNVLRSINMRLNQAKTLISDDIISSSIKSDKAALIKRGFPEVFPRGGPQKKLLAIRQFGLEYPNSGGLMRLLAGFRKNMPNASMASSQYTDIGTLIATTVSIMLKNSRTYPQCMSILSHLFSSLDSNDIERQVELIVERMSEVPNTGYFDLWMQRAIGPRGIHPEYQEMLCHHVSKRSHETEHQLWDNSWVKPAIAKVVTDTPIVAKDALASLSPIIPVNETEIFIDQY
jgi:RNA-directed DNA polymerase